MNNLFASSLNTTITANYLSINNDPPKSYAMATKCYLEQLNANIIIIDVSIIEPKHIQSILPFGLYMSTTHDDITITAENLMVHQITTRYLSVKFYMSFKEFKVIMPFKTLLLNPRTVFVLAKIPFDSDDLIKNLNIMLKMIFRVKIAMNYRRRIKLRKILDTKLPDEIIDIIHFKM